MEPNNTSNNPSRNSSARSRRTSSSPPSHKPRTTTASRSSENKSPNCPRHALLLSHKGAPESTGWKCNPLRATLPPFERLLTPVPKAWVFKAHRLQRHAAGNHVVEACVCELADTRRQAEGVADD